MQHASIAISSSINYLPRAAPSLAQQFLREIFPSVYQRFYFSHVSSAFPHLPFRVCKRRTNKLQRIYPGFSLSFRIPILSYSILPPPFSFSLFLSLFPVRWSVPSTPRWDSARLALVWSSPASGQRPSDQRTLFLSVLSVHNARVWIAPVRACVRDLAWVRACVWRCVYRVRGLDLGQVSRCRRARGFFFIYLRHRTPNEVPIEKVERSRPKYRRDRRGGSSKIYESVADSSGQYYRPVLPS